MTYLDPALILQGFDQMILDTRMGSVLDQLQEAETVLAARLGDLTVWASTPQRQAALRVVLKRMVRRVLRNPDGYTQESGEAYSYSLNPRVASGSIWVTDDDWALLGVGGSKPKTIPVGLPCR